MDQGLNLHIDERSQVPKYRQIMKSVISGIKRGELSDNEKLPSVNQLLIEHDISRDTIVKAYDKLKAQEVIRSIPGKGYYVTGKNGYSRPHICLAFNKLSVHKKIIYDSFINELGTRAAVDFFIYNNDYRTFKELVMTKIDDDYSHFVIIPHFLIGGDRSYEVLNQIPKEKLIILDKKVPWLNGEHSCIFQDFRGDIYNALEKSEQKLKKYKKLKIIFPEYSYHPNEILLGFKEFCRRAEFANEIIPDIRTGKIEKGDLFINLMEDDLIILIKRIKELGLRLGEEVGIISYNETPIKEILMDGITTISTDFELLGKTAANAILNGEHSQIAIPFRITYRNSL